MEPTPLEHGNDDAIGGADRKQVHDDGLERHEQRPEHDHQEKERQAENGTEEDRGSLCEVRGEVFVSRTGTRHEDLHA